jgi:hypothetical protein
MKWKQFEVLFSQILDIGGTEWRFGPDLPDSFCCAGNVDLEGGLLLVGGYSKDEKHLVTILLKNHTYISGR